MMSGLPLSLEASGMISLTLPANGKPKTLFIKKLQNRLSDCKTKEKTCVRYGSSFFELNPKMLFM
jgi:hypothetical protein